MASNSSLRAELSPVIENSYLAGAAGAVVSAAMIAAFLGPLGFLLLAFLPINLIAAVLVHRRRLRLREEAVAVAMGAGRGIASVEAVEDGGEMIGGQRKRRVRARVEPVDGGPSFETESVVYWTSAAPGATGIAAWHDPDDVLLYFADGPESPAELEQALNRETGQYAREPVL